MLIDVNEEQNKRVEELLDEGIANLGIPIDNIDINTLPLSSQNDIKYNPENNIKLNLDNNENYYFNYNTESSFDFMNQNNFENNNKINKDLEKKKPNCIYYGGKIRNNNLINKTIDALNTGLIIPSNKKSNIDEYKNEVKKNKSYDNCQMDHDKNRFKIKKKKKVPDLMNNKSKNDSNKNLNNYIYEYNNYNNFNANINHEISNEDNIINNHKEYRPKDMKMNQKHSNYRNNSKNGLLKNNYSFNCNENMLNKISSSFQNIKNNEYFENQNYSNSNINNINNNNNNYIKIQDNIGKIPKNKIIKKQRIKPSIKQSKINYEWKEKYEEIKKLNNNILKQLQKVQKENMIIEDKLNEVKFESENENISAMKSYLLRKQINYDKLNNDFQISENTRVKQVALIDKLEKEIKYIKSILLRQKGYK